MHSSRYLPAARCGLGLAVAACTPPSLARDIAELAPVFVSATRTPQALASVLADVRVIDSTQIRASGAATLTELLQSLGGVEIAASGGRGQTSGVFIRGSNANHVVLLIDGVRVHSASAGTNAFETIPLEQIERIEVLRGPASSLYGADAIGGVIQIFTRQAGGVQARVGAGSWRTLEASAAGSRTLGQTRLAAQGGHSRTRGFSATAPGNFSYDGDADAMRNRNLGLSVDHAWAAGQHVALRAMQSESTVHFDCGAGNDDVNRQRIGLAAIESRNRWSPHWQSIVRLARGGDDIDSRGGFCASRFRTWQDQASWQNDVAIAGGQVVAGFEARREQLDSSTRFTQTSRRIASAFGSYAAAHGAHGVHVSLRHDHNSQFSSRRTGNLAYGWQLDPAWRLSAGAGNAFKAPSFNDLYFPFTDFGGGFTFSGNPALRPERARSAELAARYATAGVQAGLTLFQNRIRDLIAVDSSASTVVNVGAARIRGVTLSGQVLDERWTARAELTRQDPVDEGSGTRLVRRARGFGSAGVTLTPGPWRAGVETVFSGSRFDSTANTPASRLGGYALLHLHAAYAMTHEWSVQLRLNNAADKHYELVQHYRTPGRNVFAALAYAAP
jgi:vitamin B12 transporter